MPLDPIITEADTRAYALMSSTPVSSPTEQRALALRIDEEIVLPLVASPPPVDVRTETVPVPGRDDVTVHVYTPESESAAGGYLFFFGGAFRQGGLHFPSVDAVLRSRAAKAGTVIVAPDYALAPEEPYPIALAQAAAVLHWMTEQADALGIDPAAVSIGGMSAGGDIAAVLALMNRDGDGIPIRRQILEVPVSDLTGGHLSLEVARDLGLDESTMVPMMRELADNYLAGADPTAPTASPLFAPDLSGLPDAHVLVAEVDVFRGDGEAYAAALQEHGTPATLHHFTGMTHGSLAYTKDVAGAQEWERTVVDLLRG
ncbi:alpha/beta hydrolase [Microbacterium hydrocarbonoxydans]|uniref:alpha/beta hydrolase n=1 Tax=Microbacterium hydrocarbonoxydans TaxID=273678 RepID=UPI00203E2AB2|nr:alpha/beta hydrolase [Microbacterium hydrocarbonoxydans]MCM3778417.1 alpha/beta hydrolase [Microbacterium hydrocarbonoxydans]